MKKILLGTIAAAALIAPLAVTGTALAYEPTGDPNVAKFGKYVGTVVTDPSTGVTTVIEDVDMNVQLLDPAANYHEFDLTYTPGADGVVLFSGVGKQWDNDGEIIRGSIDTVNNTVTYSALYLRDDHLVWEVEKAPTNGAKAGDIDWTGSWSGYALKGGFHNVPAPLPVSVPGNHGEYVSGAVKAGLKGKDLAAIAKDATLVGPYDGKFGPFVK